MTPLLITTDLVTVLLQRNYVPSSCATLFKIVSTLIFYRWFHAVVSAELHQRKQRKEVKHVYIWKFFAYILLFSYTSYMSCGWFKEKRQRNNAKTTLRILQFQRVECTLPMLLSKGKNSYTYACTYAFFSVSRWHDALC